MFNHFLLRFWQNYASLIPGATVGVLASDSRNILELIMTSYKVNEHLLVFTSLSGRLMVSPAISGQRLYI